MTDSGEHSGHEDRPPTGRRVQISVTRDGAGRPIVLSVPDWLFNAALASAAALAVLVVGGGVLTARMGAELRRLHEIEEENAALRIENRKVEVLASELEELDGLREQILFLAGAGSGNDEAVGGSGTKPPPSKRSSAATAGSVVAAEGTRESGSGSDETARRNVPAIPIPLLPPGARPAEPSHQAGGARPTEAAVQASGAPAFRWPVEGVVSKGFQVNTTPAREHHGVDIAAPHGTPVLAAAPGVVASVGIDSVFGYMVVIDHGGRLQSLYGHNSRIMVGMGDSVRAGQEIAKVGSTGESTAPHVHFEIRRGGRPVDPRRLVTR